MVKKMNNNDFTKRVMILTTEKTLTNDLDRKTILEILYYNLKEAKVIKIDDEIIFNYKGILYKIYVSKVNNKYYCLAREI